MQTISIDAGVLALPLTAAADDLYRYVDALLDWRRLLGEPWIAVRVSENTPELLVEEGLYPLRDALRQAFTNNGIIEYDANTIAQVTERLLRITPSFEAHFKVKDVLFDHLETDPPLLSLTIGQRMASDLGRCVLLMSLLRKHCRALGDNPCLIVRYPPNSGRITVRADVHDVEHGRDDFEPVPVPPECFAGDVLVYRNFVDLLMNVDQELIWMAATDDLEKELAVRLTVFKARHARGLEPEWEADLPIRYGSGFFEYADSVVRDASGDILRKILRCVSETIDRQNMAGTHVLRENASGGAPQRVRYGDSAKAWRRDIDNEYHLHYWQCPDGFIEFASMGPHNDFRIPE